MGYVAKIDTFFPFSIDSVVKKLYVEFGAVAKLIVELRNLAEN